MASFNMRQLEDRARDVDPDLRYMALEDFQKRLNNPQNQPLRNMMLFAPILFDLLGDPTTEVQNQAVKSFAPLVRHSTDLEIAQIVSRLYSEVEKTSNESKFSTSVPTLALRGIFTESHVSFNYKLSREVFDLLLPSILAPTGVMTIDKIEILIDIVKALGFALSLTELLSIITSLILKAFTEKGILGKRSIIAIDACLIYVQSSSVDQTQVVQLYDKAVLDVISENGRQASSPHSTDVFYTILQVIITKASTDCAISSCSIRAVFDEVLLGLKLDQIGETVDAEDLDIDDLIQVNLVRENAMITLAGLAPCFSLDTFIETYASQVVQILDTFLVYDPLLYDDSGDEAFLGEESELDFSDDEEIEQFENTGENDALAARLRLLALVVLKRLLQNIPKIATILLDKAIMTKLIFMLAGRSELVSNEAISTLVVLLRLITDDKRRTRSRSNSDASMATESADHLPYSIVTRDYLESIETTLFDTLLNAKNIVRFSNTKILIESLVLGFSDELSEDFLIKLTGIFLASKLSLKTLPEVVKTYKALFSTYEFIDLPRSLINYIAEDISEALLMPSSYHSIISDVIMICGVLYKKVPRDLEIMALMNYKFFPAIAQNLSKKDFSSDIRQYLLETFAELIINFDLTPSNEQEATCIFQRSLNHEASVNCTIDIMVKVCRQKPRLLSHAELIHTLLEKLTNYLASSDVSLYISSLTLLNDIFERTSFLGPLEGITALKNVLFGLMTSSVDLNIIERSFTLLGHIMRRIPADEMFILLLFTLVINTKFTDIDDINVKPLEYLINQICEYNVVGGEKFFEMGSELLIKTNFISAKIMASICANCHLSHRSDDIEQQLSRYIQAPEFREKTDQIIFDIHFLGCVSTEKSLKCLSFQEFLKIPKFEHDDRICMAAARAMGLSVVRNLESHLSVLLNCYEIASSKDDPRRSLYLVALKQLLNEGSWADNTYPLKNIWDRLIEVVAVKSGQLSHKEVLELKLAGDVLSTITELDGDGDYQDEILSIITGVEHSKMDEHIIYTVVVIMKGLVSKSADRIEVQIIEKTMGYLSVSNLELKLAIISTLLTGIYNKSRVFGSILNSVILPAIFEELSAKIEFKKTIPMGPYKYVIDEGLEVRKLSYELVSAIINLNSNKAQEILLSLNESQVFEVLLEKGLKDQENEIINMTVYILMQLILNDDSIVCKISNHDNLIASLAKLSNRKLRSKASTQETESFEDTLRSVIKLSKVVNNAFVANNAVSNEWGVYYHELQNQHHLLFSAVNV